MQSGNSVSNFCQVCYYWNVTASLVLEDTDSDEEKWRRFRDGFVRKKKSHSLEVSTRVIEIVGGVLRINTFWNEYSEVVTWFEGPGGAGKWQRSLGACCRSCGILRWRLDPVEWLPSVWVSYSVSRIWGESSIKQLPRRGEEWGGTRWSCWCYALEKKGDQRAAWRSSGWNIGRMKNGSWRSGNSSGTANRIEMEHFFWLRGIFRQSIIWMELGGRK